MVETALHAPCPQHPSRIAAEACARCGGFLCDWCVKLAPSWGPGLCWDCQGRKGASLSGRPVGGLLSAIGVLLMMLPLWTGAAAATVVRAGSPLPLRVVALAGAAALFVLDLRAAYLFIRQRRTAVPALQVLFAVLCAFELTTTILVHLEGEAEPVTWALAAFRIALALAGIGYVGRSARVRETFVR